MFQADDKILDEKQWQEEANAVIRDIGNKVKEVLLSKKLKNTNSRIHFNLTTLEGQTLCIEMSARGFSIVGLEYDRTDQRQEKCYETPYSLLDSLSPAYRQCFGMDLMKKLENLQQEQQRMEDEDSLG